MPPRYAQTWWGRFTNPEDEADFREGRWNNTSGPRTSGLLFFATVAILHAVSAAAVMIQDDAPMARLVEQLPSVIMTLAGLCLLFLGWRARSCVIRNWDAVGLLALALVVLPILVLYVHASRARLLLCRTCAAPA